MGRQGFNKKKLNTAETSASEFGTVGTDRIAGLREALRDQFLFGGLGMQERECHTITKQWTTKRCKCRMLECCVPAAAKCRLSEIYLQMHLFHKMRAWKGKFWGPDFILKKPSWHRRHSREKLQIHCCKILACYIPL